MFQRWTSHFSCEFLNSHANIAFHYSITLLNLWLQQAVVLCQVEKSKEDMLNQLYSSIRFLNILPQCIVVASIQLFALYLYISRLDWSAAQLVMRGLNHWFKRIRTSKDEETVTRNSPLFSQSSLGSLAFTITEQLLLQAGLTIVALVYILTHSSTLSNVLIYNHKMHGIWFVFSCVIFVCSYLQKAAREPMEGHQERTGWMRLTQLLVDLTHWRDMDLAAIAVVTVIQHRMVRILLDLVAAPVAPHQTGSHQLRHSLDHLTGIRNLFGFQDCYWTNHKTHSFLSFSALSDWSLFLGLFFLCLTSLKKKKPEW